MSTDRDFELGDALRDLPTPEHDLAFWEDLEERLESEPAPSVQARWRPRRFAPRGLWVLSAAAVVALVVAAVSLIDGGDRTRVEVIPATPEESTWTELPASPLSGRYGHVTVWTGERMLVWGGNGANGDGEPVNDGASYDPATKRWAPMVPSPSGPLGAATAVWTGSRMLVWGTPFGGPGADAVATSQVGAAYDPVADRWTEIGPSPLRAVGGHSAVWTGSRMLVWGGSVGEASIADGASYDPATNRWTRLSPTPLAARFDHRAVWTGDRMLVWGGFAGEESPSRVAFGDGAAYDPATDSWAMLPAAPIPGRAMHAAVWTGGTMVVWGGSGATGLLADGARYDPATGSWLVLPASPLTARLFHSAVAAQGSMLIWGGMDDQGTSNDGAAYDPLADAWAMFPDGSIGPRSGHSAVWTGSAMIVWGGNEGQDFLADGAALHYGRGRTAGPVATTARTRTGGPAQSPTTIAPGVAPPGTSAPFTVVPARRPSAGAPGGLG